MRRFVTVALAAIASFVDAVPQDTLLLAAVDRFAAASPGYPTRGEISDKEYSRLRKLCVDGQSPKPPVDTISEEEKNSVWKTNGTRLGYAGYGTEEITPRLVVNKIQLTCRVEIGWPSQNFTFLISTGSGTTWVVGENPWTGRAPHEVVLKNREVYVPLNSTQANGTVTEYLTFREDYTDGIGANGTVYRERLRVGKYDGIELQHQFIGVATNLSANLANHTAFHGVLALGKSQGSGMEPIKLPSFTDTNRSLRDRHTFSLTLKLYGGHIDFGYLNQSRYSGELFRVPLDREDRSAFHVFTASGYAVGNNSMQIRDIRAAPETASAFILLPEAMADAYYDSCPPGVEKVSMPGDNTGYVYPCDFALPDFTLQLTSDTLERKRFTVPGEDIRYEAVREGMCLGNIMALPEFQPQIAVLGWPFLKNKFLHFELDTHLGFAAAAEEL
ncbi:hypothetical protein PWT90_09400 [Aphanocladium album]|nr:hypothetical protein PWT90_09400 [Aphanocladium album]